jgi:hypothetical protein
MGTESKRSFRTPGIWQLILLSLFNSEYASDISSMLVLRPGVNLNAAWFFAFKPWPMPEESGHDYGRDDWTRKSGNWS